MPECTDYCRMEERIHRLEDEKDRNAREHTNIYNQLKKNEIAAEKHSIFISNISEKLDKIDKSLEEMKSKPEKNMNKFYGAIISTFGSLIGTGIVAAIMYGVISGLP